MSEFKRSYAEVRSMMDRFLEANRKAEENRDWSPLADFYAEDARYYYTLGAFGERLAQGREEIQKLVMERDMVGFEGWTFPYEWVVIDGDKVMTKWWNQAPHKKEDGSPYRVVGMSAIRVNNDLQIASMHDNFDLAAFLKMVEDIKAKGLKLDVPTQPDLS